MPLNLFVVEVALTNLDDFLLHLPLFLHRSGLAHRNWVLSGALSKELGVALGKWVNYCTSSGNNTDYGLRVKPLFGRFMFSEVLLLSEVHAQLVQLVVHCLVH
uniref:Uncharacterized protein n=1 Tax=Strombidium inclinatum TaxID=197538 RepID=A0A7S3IGX4_9SPIT